MNDSAFTLNITDAGSVWANGTKYSNVKRLGFQATVSGGQIVVYLTDDGTINGNPMFPNNILEHFFNASFNDSANQYQISWVVSNSNKTMTLTVNKLTSVLGVLALGGAAPNGTVVYLSIMGN